MNVGAEAVARLQSLIVNCELPDVDLGAVPRRIARHPEAFRLRQDSATARL